MMFMLFWRTELVAWENVQKFTHAIKFTFILATLLFCSIIRSFIHSFTSLHCCRFHCLLPPVVPPPFMETSAEQNVRQGKFHAIYMSRIQYFFCPVCLSALPFPFIFYYFVVSLQEDLTFSTFINLIYIWWLLFYKSAHGVRRSTYLLIWFWCFSIIFVHFKYIYIEM